MAKAIPAMKSGVMAKGTKKVLPKLSGKMKPKK